MLGLEDEFPGGWVDWWGINVLFPPQICLGIKYGGYVTQTNCTMKVNTHKLTRCSKVKRVEEMLPLKALLPRYLWQPQ